MLWAIGVSVVLVLALWLLTYATIERTSGAAVERAVDVDLAGLADIYATGGRAELVRRIGDRLAFASNEGHAAHYLVASDGGARIAGDIAQWPGLSARLSESREITLADGTEVHARATQLGPDLRLLVAREYGDTTALLNKVGLVFLAGGALLVAAVGLAGRFAANRLARRIDRINLAFREPEAEALRAIAGGAGSEDEIDELARHSASALARLERLVEAHRETSDQIAHEIRTPLMHLDSRLVKALAAAPGQRAEALLLEARADIRRLVAMLESLLDIATSKARRGDARGLREVDLSELVYRLGELYADSAEESGHAFECDVTPGVTIEGEEILLTRLVTNLLDNAFKYVPSGGSVLLRLLPGPVLIVSDNGPGIPKEERELVFKRFHRVAGQNRESQGAGLGLALAKAIAERHGLAIRLADGAMGACFIVSEEEG